MIGAGFILADPIFQGLAVALLFGLLSSTALTVLAIPAVNRVLRDPTRPGRRNCADARRAGTGVLSPPTGNAQRRGFYILILGDRKEDRSPIG